jgi:hypothetical protein
MAISFVVVLLLALVLQCSGGVGQTNTKSESSSGSSSQTQSQTQSDSPSDSPTDSPTDSPSPTGSPTLTTTQTPSNTVSNQPNTETGSPTDTQSSSPSESPTNSMMEEIAETRAPTSSSSPSMSSSSSPRPQSVNRTCTAYNHYNNSNFTLNFNAGLLPRHKETCKGRHHLAGDGRFPLGTRKTIFPNIYDGLGREWQLRRNCTCGDYRVCYEIECQNGTVVNMTVEAVLPASFNTTFGGLCHFLPFTPPPLLPPFVLAALPPGYPLPPPPQINCTLFPMNTQGIVFDIIGPTPIRVGPPDMFFACDVVFDETVDIEFGPIDIDVALIQMRCFPDPFYSCERIVLDTDFEIDVNRSKCHHKKLVQCREDEDGITCRETKVISSFVAVGVGLVLVAVLIWWLVTRRRKGHKFTRLEEVGGRGYNSRTYVVRGD